jgi:hypothetical protein
LGPTTAFDTFQVSGADTAAKVGSVVNTLSVSFFGRDGTATFVTTNLITQILAGTSGTVDFAKTATLSFLLADGQSVVFGDGRTLTGSPDVSDVPLPSSLFLLLGAMGVLGLRRSKI